MLSLIVWGGLEIWFTEIRRGSSSLFFQSIFPLVHLAIALIRDTSDRTTKRASEARAIYRREEQAVGNG
jgi:hypothetical protein